MSGGEAVKKSLEIIINSIRDSIVEEIKRRIISALENRCYRLWDLRKEVLGEADWLFYEHFHTAIETLEQEGKIERNKRGWIKLRGDKS